MSGPLGEIFLLTLYTHNRFFDGFSLKSLCNYCNITRLSVPCELQISATYITFIRPLTDVTIRWLPIMYAKEISSRA